MQVSEQTIERDEAEEKQQAPLDEQKASPEILPGGRSDHGRER